MAKMKSPLELFKGAFLWFLSWKSPLLTFVWFLGASILFLIPSSDLPDPEIPSNHLDKIVHAILFGGISFLVARDLIRTGKSKQQRIIIISILFILLFFYGWSIEYLQEHYLNRDGNIPDLIADMVGAFLGVIVISLFNKKTSIWFR